jgi:chemotaxis methyl-accepting protein methylase
MRVTVSRFFRDRSCWTDLTLKVLPVLLSGKTGDTTFRVWSAGCCGGEEPYTMALIWLEYLYPLFPNLSMDVLATDIDDSSMHRAYKGLYAIGSLRETPPEIRDKWFRRNNGMWLIDERVKELVRFEKSNLMADLPPSGMDLVLCRYLTFTYYRGERLLKAAKRLYQALGPDGALMTGHKEALDAGSKRLFEQWPGAGCTYRKRTASLRL